MRLFISLPWLLGLLLMAPAAGAQDDFNLNLTEAQMEAPGSGMCDGQPAVTDQEIRDGLEIIGEFLRYDGELTPADEETIIRGRGLTSERLNCVLGKVMAGNDIFNWGSAGAYGVSLNAEEKKLVKKYVNESQGLKEYLEEGLNITVEAD